MTHEQVALVDLWHHGAYARCSCGVMIDGGSTYLAGWLMDRHIAHARMRQIQTEQVAALLAAGAPAAEENP